MLCRWRRRSLRTPHSSPRSFSWRRRSLSPTASGCSRISSKWGMDTPATAMRTAASAESRPLARRLARLRFPNRSRTAIAYARRSRSIAPGSIAQKTRRLRENFSPMKSRAALRPRLQMRTPWNRVASLAIRTRAIARASRRVASNQERRNRAALVRVLAMEPAPASAAATASAEPQTLTPTTKGTQRLVIPRSRGGEQSRAP